MEMGLAFEMVVRHAPFIKGNEFFSSPREPASARCMTFSIVGIFRDFQSRKLLLPDFPMELEFLVMG